MSKDALAAKYLKEPKLNDKVEVSGGRLSTTSLSQGQRKRPTLVTVYKTARYTYSTSGRRTRIWNSEILLQPRSSNLKERGRAVIVISHYDRYFHVADRVMKFKAGRLGLERGKPELSDV